MNLLTKEILRLQEENEKLKSRLKTIEIQVTEKYVNKIIERLIGYVLNVFCLNLIIGYKCAG